MASPLTNARAAMIVIQVVQESTFMPEWLSKAEREAIDRATGMTGAYQTFCECQIAELEPKDQRIAMLEGHILLAYDGLSSWLADNTDEVFEEQPEIDSVRGDLWDAVHN
jgi:hypothetical protein